MKNTNEIEKQLQSKADKYLEQKAQEMFNIHKDIALHLGGKLPDHIQYITNFSDYSKDLVANRGKYFTSSSPSSMILKYQKDLAKNYKEKLVAKYTRDLLTKIDMF
tara:strand:- start:2934 stop:3251 length:318 start_codon:yes stop_codon:yes gene_type:complete